MKVLIGRRDNRIRAEAVKAERQRIKRVLENLECVNGNETEVRRQDAIDAILSDDQEANNGTT